PERSNCIVCGPIFCSVWVVVVGVCGCCGAGSWALSAQNPPIARKVPSITNKNIFLTILSSRVRACAPVGALSTLMSQGIRVQEGGDTDFVPLAAPNLNPSPCDLCVLCVSVGKT